MTATIYKTLQIIIAHTPYHCSQCLCSSLFPFCFCCKQYEQLVSSFLLSGTISLLRFGHFDVISGFPYLRVFSFLMHSSSHYWEWVYYVLILHSYSISWMVDWMSSFLYLPRYSFLVCFSSLWRHRLCSFHSKTFLPVHLPQPLRYESRSCF